MELTGAEIVVKCLQAEGVEYVFGYPGGAVCSFTTSCLNRKGQACPVRHEQGCDTRCGRYSRSSDRVGVALVTSGPGSPTR